jgi:hypothetical protein
MNSERPRIEISGLNKLDLAQLEELQHSGLSCEVQRAAGAQSPDHRARYGELATRMVILAVTPAVFLRMAVSCAIRQTVSEMPPPRHPTRFNATRRQFRQSRRRAVLSDNDCIGRYC